MKKGFGIFFVIFGTFIFLVSVITNKNDSYLVGLFQLLFWGPIGLLMIRSANKKKNNKLKEINDKKTNILNPINETLKISKSDLQKMSKSDLENQKEIIENVIHNLFISGIRLRPDFQNELSIKAAVNSKSNLSYIGESIDRKFKIDDRIDDIDKKYQTNEIQLKNKAIDKEEYEKNKTSIKRKYYSPTSSIVKISEKLHSLNIITENELNVTKEQNKLIENKEKQRLVNVIFNSYEILEKIKKEINWSKV